LPRRAENAPAFAPAVAVVVVLVLCSACGRGGRRDADSAVVVSGNIEVTDAQLAFKIPGRLVERAADEGGRVEKGKLVARLDDAELVQELAARRADQAVTEAALAGLEAGSRPQEIASAEAALRSAEAERERARLEFKRQEELRATDAVSDREFEAAQAQVRVAEARVGEASERLALVREGPRRETIAQARARVEQAKAGVALAETRLANARIDAPFSGVVLEKHAEPGEFLAAGAPVLTIADLSHVWLRAYVNQTDLGRIKLGQTVEVRTDTFPDKTYTGRLAFISDEAEFTPKTVQTSKERVTLVFRIKIALENASGELKPGMAADATLQPAASTGMK
jgi:HlyD family secretion protein